MKILVAEGSNLTVSMVRSLLTTQADIQSVTDVNSLVSELTTQSYDCLICDPAIEGWDIFRVSNLLNSFRYAEYAIPRFVLRETCPFDLVPSIARAYQINVVNEFELNDILGKLQREAKPKEALATKRISVLIVEDHVQTAQMMSAFFRKDFDVDLAFDGASAFELWNDIRHNVVLLDNGLPDTTGANVLRRILDVDPHQATIMVTGDDMPMEMVYAGAWDFFHKPFDFRALKEKITVVARLSEIERLNGYHESKLFTVSAYLSRIGSALTKDRYADVSLYVTQLQDYLETHAIEDEYGENLERMIQTA